MFLQCGAFAIGQRVQEEGQHAGCFCRRLIRRMPSYCSVKLYHGLLLQKRQL